ncbi:MAG: BON domain-containing protein [Neisseriaceae bacterium]
MKKLLDSMLLISIVCLTTLFVAQAIAQQHKSSETTKQYASGSLVTAKVKSALLAKKDIDSTKIKVKSKTISRDRTIVTLSGTQNSQEQINNAVETARNVNGVTSVVNRLRLEESKR